MKKNLFLLFFISIFFTLIISQNHMAYADTSVSEIDEFSHSIYCINSNLYICSHDDNIENNRLKIIDKQTLNITGEINNTNSENTIYNPNNIIICNNEIYFTNKVTQNNDVIYRFSTSGDCINCYSQYKYENQLLYFKDITTLATDSFGTLYCITRQNSNYIILRKTESEFEPYSIDGLNDELNINSKILISTDANTIYIIDSEKIIKLSDDSYIKIDISNFGLKNDKFQIDYLNNIYCADFSDKTITRLNYSQNEIYTTSTKYFSSVLFNDFSLDQEYGTCYLLSSEDKKLYPVNDQIFIGITQTYVSRIPSYIADNHINNQIKKSVLKQKTVSYDYPFTFCANQIFDKGNIVYQLEENGNFSLCLVLDKTPYNNYVYILTRFLDIEQPNNNEQQLKIITPKATVFKYPSTLKASKDAERENILNEQLVNQQIITCTREISTTQINGVNDYYEIRFQDNTYGYILKTCARTYQKTQEETTIKTNATISITDNSEYIEVFVFDKTRNLYTSTGYTLSHGEKIKVIDEYDQNKKYTLISFIDQDGEIVKDCYVYTKYIKMNDVGFLVLIAIILLIVSTTLGIILFITTRKHKQV